MVARRSLARFWRRLRRPTFGRVLCASLLLHVLAIAGVLAWLAREGRRPPPSQTPLIVELPPAAPGTPLVRPEEPPAAPSARAASPAPPARSAPARPAPVRPAPAPPAVAKAPAAPPPPPATRAPEPPPAPPVVAKAEPAPAPPPPAAPAPSPAPVLPPPAPPVPAPAPEPALRSDEPTPAPPAVAAARPPEPTAPAAPAPPVASTPPAAPAPSPGPPAPSTDSIFGGGGRYSLLAPRLDVPPLPPVGRGGSRSDGEGSGESGRATDGQVAVPLNTPDPRYAEYFAELKRRIEDKWVYPAEAARRGESGQGEVRFLLRKDGTVRVVEIVHSTGVVILDRYIANAIRMAAPFPPIPESVGESVIPISLNYTYVLGGSRLFGYR